MNNNTTLEMFSMSNFKLLLTSVLLTLLNYSLTSLLTRKKQTK